jgi:virginiamycin B lyase
MAETRKPINQAAAAGRPLILVMAAFLCCAARSRAQTPPQLPDGNGKETIQKACASCHALSTVTNAGHNRKEWSSVLGMMVAAGAPVPKDQIPTVADYLAKNFPERPAPEAVVIPGSVEVSIKEWQVPTAGSRPHDPAFAPDGSVWYTGQMANVLGRFDPKTSQFKEYPLKTPSSGPHGLVADQEGNIWFTANFKAYIGKLDAKTGNVTEYPMPDPEARDPHTLLFAPNGKIYFTVQGGNMVGRLDPKTGEVQVVRSPTPKSNPYGMVVSSEGLLFFVEFGSNKVASLDPDTLAIHEYVLPHVDSHPRRVAITPDDVIWYSDYSRGYLGRLDPKTGKISEWPSPGGPRSRPYAITAVGEVIWYSESNTKPNTVVRFDTKTEKFQTWIIPSGGGVVRNMVSTPDGNLWLACSGVNGIAFVEVKKSAKVASRNGLAELTEFARH